MLTQSPEYFWPESLVQVSGMQLLCPSTEELHLPTHTHTHTPGSRWIGQGSFSKKLAWKLTYERRLSHSPRVFHHHTEHLLLHQEKNNLSANSFPSPVLKNLAPPNAAKSLHSCFPESSAFRQAWLHSLKLPHRLTQPWLVCMQHLLTSQHMKEP